MVSNPEFLREGTSVHDYLNPPLTLIGTDCELSLIHICASFLIIGFSFFFKEEKCKKDTIIFVFFSIISVLIHYVLVIMPIAYYLMTIDVYKRQG